MRGPEKGASCAGRRTPREPIATSALEPTLQGTGAWRPNKSDAELCNSYAAANDIPEEDSPAIAGMVVTTCMHVV